MKTLSLIAATLFLSISAWQGEKMPQTKTSTKPSGRSITIKLITGEELRGNLVYVDNETVDFTVKGILQSVEVDKVTQINFLPATQPSGISSKSETLPVSNNLRPTITHTEKAGYTKAARENKVEGTVLLSLVYTYDGRITDIRVVRGLPDGLTENAIEAAKKIKFKPAMKDGQPVSVRGNVEFNFYL